MGWLTRKAISLATVTQDLKSYSAPPDDSPSSPPVSHIVTQQTATGGIKGTTEHRTLDWTVRPHTDYLFGELQAKSRWSTLELVKNGAKDAAAGEKEEWYEGDAEYLTEGWGEESKDGEVVESWARNAKAGWTGWQVWGFEVLNKENGEGERWLVRRLAIRKGEKVERARLVYTWAGEN